MKLQAGLLAIVLQAALAVYALTRVAFTDIDWTAYVQEVEPVLYEGQYDYLQLKGDTGAHTRDGHTVA
jgi:hypothetical protein